MRECDMISRPIKYVHSCFIAAYINIFFQLNASKNTKRRICNCFLRTDQCGLIIGKFGSGLPLKDRDN